MGSAARNDSSSSSPHHKYFSSVDESKSLVFSGNGNLQGYLCENDSGSDVFIAFYDAANAGDVTLGVTAPAFTQKIAAGAAFGRDSNGYGYKNFGLGCVVAVVSARNGAAAPAAPAILETWSSKK